MKKNRICLIALSVLLICICGVGIGAFFFKQEISTENPDEYAWISVQGTKIDGPLLQNPEDNSFYADHNAQREEDSKGAFYTETYNSKTFEDPITVVYGNNNTDGTMFGELFRYADDQYMEEHPVIQITAGNVVYTYRIFAAYKTDNRHIMERFDGGKTRANRQAYLDSIFQNRSMEAQIDRSVPVDAESKILTLSTHVAADEQARFLVQACLEEKQKVQ